MKKFALSFTLLGLWAFNVVHAAEFFCSSGNVTCLIAAINTANANGQKNRIDLAPGTYSLTSIDNNSDGSNGLPSVVSALTISGAGSARTTIERAVGSPFFRLMHVASTGRLTLEGLTLQGGNAEPETLGGSGIFNRGQLRLSRSILTNNGLLRGIFGGGIRNEAGTVTISDSALVGNDGGGVGGAIWNIGGSGRSYLEYRQGIHNRYVCH
jgi:hypothetical protein